MGKSTRGIESLDDWPTKTPLSARALSRKLNRRQVLAGALGFSMMGLLAACGADDDDGEESPTVTAATGSEPTATLTAASEATATSEPSSTTPPTAPTEAADTAWEFTDGRGVTVRLPKPPERIVAFAAAAGALWDFGIRPIGIFGTQRLADGSVEPTVGSADLDSMTSIGDTNDDIDVEALLALQPDLVISTMNTSNDIWGMQDESIAKLVEQVAPVIGMTAFFEPIDQLIGNFEELAVALGGDPDSPEVAGSREAFDAASESIRAITSEKADLSVIVCSGNNENFFFASTEMFPDLIYLESLGVPFVKPDGVEFSGPWGMVSWEEVGQFAPDAIFADSRRGWPPTAFANQPTWEGLAAVQANQVEKWTPLVPLSYGGMATILNKQAEFLSSVDENLA